MFFRASGYKYPCVYGLKEKALFIWKENSDEKDKAR